MQRSLRVTGVYPTSTQAEKELNQRLQEEAEARSALEKALQRREKEEKLLKAQREASSVRKVVEDGEKKAAEAAEAGKPSPVRSYQEFVFPGACMFF